MNIVRTFWRSIKDLFEELFILALVNILWLLINAPAAIALLFFANGLGAFLLVLMLGVITIGPSTAGVYAIAERVTEGRTSSWRHFFQGMRAYAVLSWKVYGLWMLGLVVILFNLRFYNNTGNTVSTFLMVVFLYIALIWFSLLIYIGPLMFLQTDKQIRTIARNAALMAFGRPIFTGVTLVLMAVIAIASYLLPIIVLLATFSFLAVWSFRATLTLIAEAEARRAAAEEAALTKPADKGRSGQIRPRE
jgi:uncharacterized membrane protein YesL